jgi:hypothetical protein
MRRRYLMAIIAGIASLPLAAKAQQPAPPDSASISKCAQNPDGFPQWGGLPGNVLLAFEVGNP